MQKVERFLFVCVCTCVKSFRNFPVSDKMMVNSTSKLDFTGKRSLPKLIKGCLQVLSVTSLFGGIVRSKRKGAYFHLQRTVKFSHRDIRQQLTDYGG